MKKQERKLLNLKMQQRHHFSQQIFGGENFTNRKYIWQYEPHRLRGAREIREEKTALERVHWHMLRIPCLVPSPATAAQTRACEIPRGKEFSTSQQRLQPSPRKRVLKFGALNLSVG
jgi:hypothetical protein